MLHINYYYYQDIRAKCVCSFNPSSDSKFLSLKNGNFHGYIHLKPETGAWNLPHKDSELKFAKLY